MLVERRYSCEHEKAAVERLVADDGMLLKHLDAASSEAFDFKKAKSTSTLRINKLEGEITSFKKINQS